MPDQNENMQKSNEEPRRYQGEEQNYLRKHRNLVRRRGENEGCRTGISRRWNFLTWSFRLYRGKSGLSAADPVASVDAAVRRWKWRAPKPSESTEQTGRISWGTVAADRGVSDSGLPGKYTGRFKQPSLLLYHPVFECERAFDPVNISIGNKTVAHQVPYGEVTSYYTETTGFKQILVTEAGRRGAVLARERFLFNDGDVYTIALVNGMNGIVLVLVPDFPCRNQMQNFACVRAANLSYNAPAIDVVNRTGRIVFDDLRFKSVSAYRQFMEGQQMFLVTEAESGAEIFDLTEWVEPGKMYTLYVIGDAYVFPGLNGVFTEDYSLLAD